MLLAPGQLAPDLDAWFGNALTRKALLDFAGLTGRAHTEHVVDQARAWLERALDRGDVIALESRVRRVVLTPSGATPSIGPEEPAPLGDDFLWALVFDSTGAPIADARGLTLDAFEPGRSKARFENLRLSGGGGGVPALRQGGPLSFDLKFTVPEDTVPADADPVGPPSFGRANVNKNGPLGDPIVVTRRDLVANKQSASLDVNNVFQLRRREAEVVELEHFNDGSAVFLPAEAPDSVYRAGVRERPLGIDVLNACLTFAQGFAPDQMIITGHDAQVSQQRADCIRALLVGDDASRSTWIQVAITTQVDSDVRAILKWAAGAFGWGCDPEQPNGRALAAAVQELKIGYNRDVRDKLFGSVGPDFPLLEDGKLDPPAWGAIFDCYMRALRRLAATAAQPPWAKFPIGDDRTRSGKNATRPQAKHPFVVLGRDGPGNAPVTIAQHGALPQGNGDPNLAFTVFQDVNPQYRVGVDPEFPGQALNVPDAWADNLAASGYTVERDPLLPPPSPADAGPPALAAPGPRAVGCGAHHLTAPFVAARDRRGARRNGEVVFIGSSLPIVDCGAGAAACTSSRCELYDPREYEIDYVPVDATPLLLVDVVDESGNAVGGAKVKVIGDRTIRRRADDNGKARVAGLAASKYRVTAKHESLGKGVARVRTAASGTRRVRIRMPAAPVRAKLTVRLRSLFALGGTRPRWNHGTSHENMIAGARVSVGGITSPPTNAATGETSLDLSSLPDGPATLSIEPASGQRTTDRAGPDMLSTASPPLPERLFRPLSLSVVLKGGLLDPAFTPAFPKPRVDNADVVSASPRLLFVDWRPDWVRAGTSDQRRAAGDDEDSDVELIVVHQTDKSNDIGPHLNTFTGTDATIHYLVDVDGFVVKMTRDEEQARHAGDSFWGGHVGVNLVSIGIEQVHDGTVAPFPHDQVQGLIRIISDLQASHLLGRRSVVTHCDIGVPTSRVRRGHPRIDLTRSRRNDDPGPTFPHLIFKSSNVGLGPIPVPPSTVAPYGGIFTRFPGIVLQPRDRDDKSIYGGAARSGITVAVLDELQGDLSSIGYSIAADEDQNPSGEYDAATRGAVEGFQRHFMNRGSAADGNVDDATAAAIKGVLADLDVDLASTP